MGAILLMKRERVLYLDMIRIIGFLAITAYHFAVTAGEYNIFCPYIDVLVGVEAIAWGPIALSCFFMVSGAALIYRYEDGLTLKEYYKKRFLGIFPLFWLAYLFAFVIQFYRTKSISRAPRISFLLTVIGMDGYLGEYVNNFYLIGEWFLGAIIILYILFPFYRLIMCRCRYILPLVFLGASIWLLYNNPFDMVLEKNPIVCSMYFVLGMLFEMIRKGPNQKAVVIGRRAAAAVGVGLYIVVYLIERSGHYFDGYHKSFVLSISLYMIVMEVSTWIKPGRIQEMITVIGRHSFAYFLIHHIFLDCYLQNFSGLVMADIFETMVLFLTSVGFIYLLAVGLDKVYAYLAGAFGR